MSQTCSCTTEVVCSLPGVASPAQSVPGVVRFHSGEHASYAALQAAVARRLQSATAGADSAALLSILAQAGAGQLCSRAEVQLAALTPMAVLSALGGNEDSPPAQPPDLTTRAGLHLLSAAATAPTAGRPIAQVCSPFVAPSASCPALSAESVFVDGDLSDSAQGEQDIALQLLCLANYDICLACGTPVDPPCRSDAGLCLFCSLPGGADL